jgi:hypothetical protein
MRVDNGTLDQIGAIPTGGDRPLFQALAIRQNQGPVASLRPVSGVVGLAIQFDASDSFDPDGEIARYDCDFGDGETAVDRFPSALRGNVGSIRRRDDRHDADLLTSHSPT